MTTRANTAEEGLLCWIERWPPPDADAWARWRASLSKKRRASALLPLQAVLSGLVAARQLEEHRAESEPRRRAQLHAVRTAYAWALRLVHELGSNELQPHLRATSFSRRDPETSLDDLHRSLTDALRICDRLLESAMVDDAVFESSSDFFLRDLSRNTFFRPPEPLEFVNVAEFLGSDRFLARLDASRRGASSTATTVAFLALLRCHRFLGIADEQMTEADGVYRAHVVMTGVRRELRMLTRFLVLQDAEVFAGRLERDLTKLAAYEIENPLPSPTTARGLALPAERMRNAIRELRRSVKATARRLRDIEAPDGSARVERPSGRVRKNIDQEVWAFRFILRAFLAKASALPLVEGAHDASQLAFAAEFVRHFRVFGPRLAKATGYAHRGRLTTAVSALVRRDAVDDEALELALEECERFAQHLDRVLSTETGESGPTFDKREAADALRSYLAQAKERSLAEQPPMGAFGGLGTRATKAS